MSFWRHNEYPYGTTRWPHLLYKTQGKFSEKLSACDQQNLTNTPALWLSVCVRIYSDPWEAEWCDSTLSYAAVYRRFFPRIQTKWHFIYNSVNFITCYVQSTYCVRSTRHRVMSCRREGCNETNMAQLDKKAATHKDGSSSVTLSVLSPHQKTVPWERLRQGVDPDGSDGKESACSAGDPGLIPGSGRSPGQEDPLEEGTATHSTIPAWRIPMDRGAWWGRKELDTTEWLSLQTDIKKDR